MENSLTRTFIALDLPEPIKDQIYTLYKTFFRKYTPFIKWVKKENLHLTLKFLGSITDEKITEIKNILAKINDHYHLIIDSFGVFPTNRMPRVFWIGLEDGNKQLEQCFNLLEGELQKIGFAKEERRFVPHLTIARLKIKNNFELKEFEKIKEEFEKRFVQLKKENFQVEKITLFKSELTSQGSIYTKIFE